MKQPLLSSVWSAMLDGKSSSCKIKALEGSKPTGAIVFEFIKLYSYGINNIFAFSHSCNVSCYLNSLCTQGFLKWVLRFIDFQSKFLELI